MNPIAVVGAGISGLAAAAELHSQRLPFILVDEHASIAGPFATVHGDGWITDPLVPWITHSDTAVLGLIRTAGLEAQLAAFQEPVRCAHSTGLEPLDGGPFQTLRHGFGSLFDHWAMELPRPMTGTHVAALRWIPERQAFLFRDGRTGATLSHPITRRRIEASAVILAVPPRRLTTLTAQSRVLLPASPRLSLMATQSFACGVFVVPRIESPWSALLTDGDPVLSLIVREDAKSSNRIESSKSVLVAHANATVADSTRNPEALLRALYEALRSRLPEFPDQPLDARVIQWETSSAVNADAIAAPLETDPHNAPIAIAMRPKGKSLHEGLALAGIRAAREVIRLLKNA